MEQMVLATFGEIMSYVGYVFLAILILLIMITVHELGHYLVGKWLGFGIEEFAIGFGPKLFNKTKKNGEVFSIRAIPLGGFCQFKGEDKEDQDPTAFNNKKPWARILVLIAGAVMNYITALFIIMIMFGVYGQPTLNTYKLKPQEMVSEYSAFNEKDTIISANGRTVYLVSDLMGAIDGYAEGSEIPFRVRRNGEDVNITVTLKCDAVFKNLEDAKTLYDALGIYYELDESGNIINGGLYSTYVRLSFFTIIGRSFEYSAKLGGTIFAVLGQLITGRLGISAMGGTVTTIAVTADAIAKGGFRYFLNIASLIGVNLAVFNLLPIPALDGSRVVFTVIEWIRGKPINRKVEAVIHALGFVLLIAFAVLVDLQRCF